MKKFITVTEKKQVEIELAEFYKDKFSNSFFQINEKGITCIRISDNYTRIYLEDDFNSWYQIDFAICEEIQQDKFNEAVKIAMTKLNLL